MSDDSIANSKSGATELAQAQDASSSDGAQAQGQGPELVAAPIIPDAPELGLAVETPAKAAEEPLASSDPAVRKAAPARLDKRVVVVGLGGAGCKTLDKLAQMPEANWLELLAIDTDREALNFCGADNRMLAASEWRDGAGCGGDVIKGERSISRERARLTQLVDGASLLVVVGGLGGGTATGGARILASIARSSSIPTVFLLSAPFSFEAHRRRKAAEDCVSELLPTVDILLCLPNDLLFSTLSPDVSVADAFDKSCEELAGTVFGICEMLRARNLLSADFATLMSSLHERRSACGVGIGQAASDEGLNRCHLAIERMLASPFLGGVSKLAAADAAIVGLTGGPDLEIGEMKKALETVSSLCGGADLVVGANTDPALLGKVQVTVVAIKYDRMPDKPAVSHEKARHWSSGSRGLKQAQSASTEMLEQGLLELQSFAKGIFSNLPPTKYKDEDLDVPTFQRRGVVIDKGETGH